MTFTRETWEGMAALIDAHLAALIENRPPNQPLTREQCLKVRHEFNQQLCEAAMEWHNQ